MKIKSVVTSIGLVVSAVLALSNSAQAASFTTNVDQKTDPKSGY